MVADSPLQGAWDQYDAKPRLPRGLQAISFISSLQFPVFRYPMAHVVSAFED
jgi:hypothetical protein